MVLLGLILGMIYGSKDIYNQVIKIKKRIADGGYLEKYFTEIELEGGTVKWKKSDAGDVVVL